MVHSTGPVEVLLLVAVMLQTVKADLEIKFFLRGEFI